MADVLVADDDPALCRLFELWLESAGFAVRSAADGVEALVSIAAQGRPDAAVVDISMPRVDGLEPCWTRPSRRNLRVAGP